MKIPFDIKKFKKADVAEPKETKARKRVNKALVKKRKAQVKRIERILSKKVISRGVVKPNQVAVRITEPEPKKDVGSSFFKRELEAETRSLFFK